MKDMGKKNCELQIAVHDLCFYTLVTYFFLE